MSTSCKVSVNIHSYSDEICALSNQQDFVLFKCWKHLHYCYAFFAHALEKWLIPSGLKLWFICDSYGKHKEWVPPFNFYLVCIKFKISSQTAVWKPSIKYLSPADLSMLTLSLLFIFILNYTDFFSGWSENENIWILIHHLSATQQLWQTSTLCSDSLPG